MDKKKNPFNATVRNILLMVLSLVCSLLLWIYVTDTEGQEIDRSIPGVEVVFQGEAAMRESRGLIVSDTAPKNVTVTLNGSRRVVSSLWNTDLSAAVDLSGITRSGNYYLAPSVVFPSRMDTSSISATVSPAGINFYVDVLDKKTIPVEGVFNGNPAEGYAAESLEFSPSTVIIRGPEKVLDQVEKAYVEVSRNDVDKTLSYDSTYVLLDAEGQEIVSDEISLDTETVKVTLPIRSIKDVSLVVELLPGGGATESNVKWRLEPDVITLTGDSETLAGVNSITVARVDLATITEDTYTDTYRIVIPNNTEITSGAKETTLRLEMGGLYSKPFTVPKRNITCTNVSAGYACEIVNDAIENVVIRGPEDAVQRVSDLNIRAVANLTEYGSVTGVFSVPVKIEVDGSTEVGAVGEYRIYVNIVDADREGEQG